MKKKLLASVIAAGLGFAGAAQAVYVNSDGTGQVLLYPYYTVQQTENGQWDTYVHIVNTTDQAKAVKVRVLEGMNSQEVLDFNLYLSPQDVWTGVIVRTAQGAALRTSDTSCTVGDIVGRPNSQVDFRNFLFDVAGETQRGLDRTREGYIEVIEMGELQGALAAAATHGANGRPTDCAAIRAAAINPTSTLNSRTVETAISAPTGGLYGFSTLINVEEGRATTVDAVALDGFFEVAAERHLHYEPGDELPALTQVNTDAIVFRNGQAVTYRPDALRPAVDAVSAVLTHQAVANDYMVEDAVLGQTDWVITFPTKRFYVNGATPPLVPFSTAWTGANRSCDEVDITIYNREEAFTTVDPEEFSPRPPAGAAITLCNEVNTVTFNRTREDGSESGSVFAPIFTAGAFTVPAAFQNGWAQVEFTNGSLPVIQDPTGTPAAVTLPGLPVIGFSAMSYTNGVRNGGSVLRNYLGSSVLKGINN
ncbi:hypothetical protein [Pseudothauera hydrothermalis]|uniref:hypothetical protein n=1 Tax=Pseudothauera hydrothermalis TaxID=2184083 RepID=UPI000E09756D|nr:hypothetical protein [Pseudothauera hydrothermalis]